MDEFVCQKCKALLGIFPKEILVKCSCGMAYDIDWGQSPPKAKEWRPQAKEEPRIPAREKEEPRIPAREKEESQTSVNPEIEAIYQEMHRQKMKAIELDLPKLVMGPCLNEIESFPSWKDKESQAYIPPEMTDISQSDSEEGKGVSFRFSGHSYRYCYQEKTESGLDDYIIKYRFEFCVDGRPVLECQGICRHGKEEYERDSGPTKFQLLKQGYFEAGLKYYKFTPINIKAFIEGEWVNEIRKMAGLIEQYKAIGEKILCEKKEKKERQEREDPERLVDLKRRFGID